MKLSKSIIIMIVGVVCGCSIKDKSIANATIDNDLTIIQSESGWCAVYGNCGQFVDHRDDKTYKWTKIGSQKIWMAENISYKSLESICYNNSDSLCNQNGRLYKYTEALYVCPAGWSLPEYSDWNELKSLVGANDYGSYKLLSKIYYNGTDEYGFNGILAGANNIRMTNGFGNIGRVGGWWVTNDNPGIKSNAFIYIELKYPIIFTGKDPDEVLMNSVRCIKSAS